MKVQPAPVASSLVSVNEKEELRAQKEFYEKIESEMGRRLARKLAFWKKVSLVYMPAIALVFAAIYWVSGLKHANVL